MAEIEVRRAKGKPFIKDMVESTGLTRDQIRHRRSQPIYNDYIELARRNKTLLKEPRAALTRASEPPLSAPPTIGETFDFDSAQPLLDVASPRESVIDDDAPDDSHGLRCSSLPRCLTSIPARRPLHHRSTPARRQQPLPPSLWPSSFHRQFLLAQGPIFPRSRGPRASKKRIDK